MSKISDSRRLLCGNASGLDDQIVGFGGYSSCLVLIVPQDWNEPDACHHCADIQRRRARLCCRVSTEL